MNKSKKRKRRLTISIISLLVAAWIVVSAVFCVIVLNNEKDNLVAEEKQTFSRLVNRLEDYMFLSHGKISLCLESFAEHQDSYLVDDEEYPKLTYGAYPLHDNKMQIIAYSSSLTEESEELQDTLIMDTDIHDYVLFICNIDSVRSYKEGKIEFDDFIASIDDEDYKDICDYLYTEDIENDCMYELVCKEFYYENPGVILPKTVSILKIVDSTYEIVETYSLNPAISDNSEIFEANDDDMLVNIISGSFAVGDNDSGGLISDPFDKNDSYKELDTFNGEISKKSAFTYTYENRTHMLVDTISEQYENSFSEDVFTDPQVMDKELITVHYKREFNILESCKHILFYGVIIGFGFFFIIGAVIVISTRRIITAQLREEEKRREVTNALAHDIKTPLFIISGYAQNLKENVNTDKREHYAERIIERTNEVNELVHKMLDFSKLDSLEQSVYKEEFELKKVIEESIADYNTLSGDKTINFTAHDCCTINADKKMMSRVVSYLLDNAVKYSDSSTEISIELSRDSFSIANVCSFITDDDIKHIMEPYYKADKNRNSKGNGLGLSIVKSIIDLHRFEIEISLEDNVFTFRIMFK